VHGTTLGRCDYKPQAPLIPLGSVSSPACVLIPGIEFEIEIESDCECVCECENDCECDFGDIAVLGCWR
jgi:hypothetical protein